MGIEKIGKYATSRGMKKYAKRLLRRFLRRWAKKDPENVPTRHYYKGWTD